MRGSNSRKSMVFKFKNVFGFLRDEVAASFKIVDRLRKREIGRMFFQMCIVFLNRLRKRITNGM